MSEKILEMNDVQGWTLNLPSNDGIFWFLTHSQLGCSSKSCQKPVAARQIIPSMDIAHFINHKWGMVYFVDRH